MRNISVHVIVIMLVERFFSKIQAAGFASVQDFGVLDYALTKRKSNQNMKFFIAALALLGAASGAIFPGSANIPLPGSDTFTQQQAAYWTSVSKQIEDQGKKFTGKITLDNLNYGPAYAGEIKSTAEVPPVQDTKYYTGYIKGPVEPPVVSAADVLNNHVDKKAFGKITFNNINYAGLGNTESLPPPPGSDDFTNQQGAYWSAVRQQNGDKKFTGKIRLDNLKYGPGYAGDITSDSNSESLPPPPGSDDFTNQQGAYWSAVSKQNEQPEKKYYTGLVYIPGQDDAAPTNADGADTMSAAVMPGSDDFTNQQGAYWSAISKQNEDKKFTGKIRLDNLKYGPGYAGDIPSDSNTESLPPPPGSDDFTNQQGAYWSAVSKQNEQPEKKYYTGLVYIPGQDDAAATPVDGDDTMSAAVMPGSDDFTNQQGAYWSAISKQNEDKKFTGKIQLDNLKYGPGYAGDIPSDSNTESLPPPPGSDDFTNQQAAHWSSVSNGDDTMSAAVMPGSDDFTNQQAAYWSSQTENPEDQYHTGLVYIPGQDDDKYLTTVEEALQKPEDQYHTGLVYIPGQDDDKYLTTVEEALQKPEDQYHTGLVYIPGQDDDKYLTTVEEALKKPETEKKFYTGLTPPPPEQKYYTGLIPPPEQKYATGAILPEDLKPQPPKKEYYTGLLIPEEFKTQEPENKQYSGLLPPTGTNNQKPPKQYYTGLLIPEELKNQQPVKQYYTGLSIPEEFKTQKPENKYFTGLLPPTGSNNQKPEQKYYTGLLPPTGTNNQKPPKQYYTGLLIPEELQNQQPVKQYYTGLSIPEEFKTEKPEIKYYTGLLPPTGANNQKPQKQYYTGLSIPEEFKNQQPVKEYYTGLLIPEELQNQQPVKQYYTGLSIPEDLKNQQPVKQYYTGLSIPEEFKTQQPENKYYTGLLPPSGTNNQKPQQKYYTGLLPPTGANNQKPQQKYYTGLTPPTGDYWNSYNYAQQTPKKDYYTGLAYYPGQYSSFGDYWTQQSSRHSYPSYSYHQTSVKVPRVSSLWYNWYSSPSYFPNTGYNSYFF
ncbi:uncharacterized protein LOC106094810 [Stomoxys calcitrans]|uniref:uncharacterized protein LOC106094810 n=1 Tax=Stomoxys calcitrans TaxID=35570 RepID=UPI0027E2948E|nr:uncharacterized protein LOC106094810 [Stomoxys calcitrans]